MLTTCPLIYCSIACNMSSASVYLHALCNVKQGSLLQLLNFLSLHPTCMCIDIGQVF